MKSILYLIIATLFFTSISCDPAKDEKKLLKQVQIPGYPNGQTVSTPKEISNKIAFQGSTFEITAQISETDNVNYIKNLSFYQSGNKDVIISNIQVGNPLNYGTEQNPLMVIDGSFSFQTSSVSKSNLEGHTFTVTGDGKILFDTK